MAPESTTLDTPPEESKSLVQKLGATLPIALAMLATTFAGMSTGQLQESMFWRSYAAQDQAKATGQWTLAGFKRDRSLICETTAAVLHASSGYKAFAPPSGADPAAVEWLNGNGPPKADLPAAAEKDKNLAALFFSNDTRATEKDILNAAKYVKQQVINDAVDEAENATEAIDKSWDPTVKAAAKLVEDVVKKAGSTEPHQASAALAAGFELERRRYRAESRFNQQIGYLYDARVKVSTAESDRHREKSKNLFYAMLAAQIGAVISSLALNRKQSFGLVVLATFAGLMSIGVGAAVFLM